MDAQGVYEKLKAKGRAISIRTITATGADPDTGNPGTTSASDKATYAVEEEMTIANLASLARDLGTDVSMKDKQFMVAAVDTSGAALSIAVGMFVVDGSAVYSISVPPRPLKPANEILYWTVQVRGV